jgi:hypothetical protein
MSYYANIVNGVVVEVRSIDDDYFQKNKETRYAGQWVQTSYNTRGGVHYNPETGKPSKDQSKALRKNYAGIGFTYSEELDGFIPPKPEDGEWELNEETCLWEEVKEEE